MAFRKTLYKVALTPIILDLSTTALAMIMTGRLEDWNPIVQWIARGLGLPWVFLDKEVHVRQSIAGVSVGSLRFSEV